MKHTACQSTAAGRIGIEETDGAITALHLNCDAPVSDPATPLLTEAFRQLTEYLQDKRTCFELPLAPEGTPFQKQVWSALCEIPYGETRSYKEIAEAVGNPQGCRAVGMANNRNPIAIFIPCHRVIGSSQKLVGYAGGLELKQQLLKLEGVIDELF